MLVISTADGAVLSTPVCVDLKSPSLLPPQPKNDSCRTCDGVQEFGCLVSVRYLANGEFECLVENYRT